MMAILMITLLLLFSLFQPVPAPTDTRSGTGLTSFPTDFDPAVTKIMLTTNSITDIPPSELTNLPVLNYIGIAENSLTVFPDLTPIAGTLEKLYAYENLMTTVDGTLLEALNVLTHLSLQNNLLTTFPTITSGSCLTLEYLNIANNPIVSPIYLDQFVVLNDLWLKYTEVSEIPDVGASSQTLVKLRLESTNVVEVPVKKITALANVEWLYFTSTSVTNVPSPCNVVVADLDVRVTSTSVDLCSCRHVWMKLVEELGGKVVFDDMDCYGETWSTTNTQHLIDNCRQLSTGNTQTLLLHSSNTGAIVKWI